VKTKLTLGLFRIIPEKWLAFENLYESVIAPVILAKLSLELSFES